MADRTETGSLHPDDGDGAENVPDHVPWTWTVKHSGWAKRVIGLSYGSRASPAKPGTVSWRQAIVAVLAGPILVVVLLVFVSVAFATSPALGTLAFVGCTAPYLWIAWSQRPSQ